MDTTIRNIIVIIAIFALLKFTLGSKTDKKANIPDLLANGAILIDVRTPGEFSRGHIKGAINIPVDSITVGIEKKAKDKSAAIVLYCHSGARSGSAKKTLAKEGYTNVVNAGSLHRMHKLLGQ